jgi:murein DD-endopeptidase MepM/ murein hydrolase activator NlpD
MTQAASVTRPTQVPTPSKASATEDQGAAPEEGAQPDTAGEGATQHLGIVTYVVQEADTLPSIADRWGLDPLSILWCNEKSLPTVHMLHPGLELFIPPEDGACVITSGERTLEQIAQAYAVSAHDIIDSPHNELYGMVPDDRPEPDTLIFIPGGVGRDQESYWMPTETTNPECGNRVVNYAPGHPGSCGEVEFPKELAAAGEWVSPLYFYSHISRRYSDWHPGTDIVSSAGTPIFAADSGVVVFSGWHNWGYGNLVVLDHGNDWSTLYAHLSLIYVGCGEIVSQGDVIGTLGNTGNSSGPHLHYEMHLKGRALDPQIHGGL